jgi:hypothetical protein
MDALSMANAVGQFGAIALLLGLGLHIYSSYKKAPDDSLRLLSDCLLAAALLVLVLPLVFMRSMAFVPICAAVSILGLMPVGLGLRIYRKKRNDGVPRQRACVVTVRVFLHLGLLHGLALLFGGGVFLATPMLFDHINATQLPDSRYALIGGAAFVGISLFGLYATSRFGRANEPIEAASGSAFGQSKLPPPNE